MRLRTVRARHRGDAQRGAALVVTVMVAVVLAGLGTAALSRATKEAALSGLEAERAAAFEAAQAGVDDYIAKMTEDHQYYLHYVHPAESTRQRPAPNATVRVPSTAAPTNLVWPGDTKWSYPNGRDRWKALSNGFEFNLQIVPPDIATNTVATTVIASGRRTGSVRSLRTIEVQVRGTSIADFQMFSASDITVGAGATTNGRYYAGVDAGGVKHSITHNGNANADVIAEATVSGTTTWGNVTPGVLAKKIDSTTPTALRKVVGLTPPQFGNFSDSITQVKRAAQSTTRDGIFIDLPAWDGIALKFKSTGTIDIYGCKKASASLVLGAGTTSQRPVCTAPTGALLFANKPVPTVGAIYVQQSVMVSGQVQGRVTVATGGDAILGDPIGTVSSNYGSLSYVTAGKDVIGIIANFDVIVPYWSASDTSVVGAFLALNGARHSWNSDGSHNSFTHVGATASNQHPFMDMFVTRTYSYDTNLQFLQPPFFPVLEQAYAILRFREINPP